MMKKLGLVAAVVIGVTAMVGCGDDDEAASSGDPERYCELVAELETIGGEVFEDVPEDASDEDLAAAEADFVERAAASLDEMVDVAPQEIADDVEAYTAAIKQRADGGEGPDVGDEEERILEYEEANC